MTNPKQNNQTVSGEINYGSKCVCQKKNISICRKCELYDSLKIANAFSNAGYMVNYQYCKKHQQTLRRLGSG